MEQVISLQLNFKNQDQSLFANDLNDDVKNLDYFEEYFKRACVNRELSFGDLPVADSIIQSRADSVDEGEKYGLYKQAQNIKNLTLANPKEKRINDSIVKVFGLNDPPPGFGLSYPKYYYLEQKRPQPMSPLKVWRGFNGNIYFEPIICNTLNTYVQLNNKKKQIEIEESSLKTKIEDTLVDENNEDLKVKDSAHNKEIISTEAAIENLKSQKLLPQIKDFDAMSTSTINGNKQYIKFSTNSSSMKSKPPNTQHHNSPNIFVTKELTFSNDFQPLRRNPSFISRDQRSILPNLSAVKRNNSPVKGLAYKEIKNRFSSEGSSKSDTTQASAQKDSVINQSVHKDYELERKNTSYEGFVNSSENFSGRPTYRDMLKNIRKGITLSNLKKTKSSELNVENRNLKTTIDRNRNLMVRKDDKQLDYRFNNYLKIELMPLRDPFKSSSLTKFHRTDSYNYSNYHSSSYNNISAYSLSLTGLNATPDVENL